MIERTLRKLIYGIFLLLAGCLDPFVPPTSSYENLLVVEALITDDPSSQYVRLSRSYPIDTSQFIPESGAEVKLLDAKGGQYIFEETGPGYYQVDPTRFVPVAGESYTLLFTTREGRSYRSEPVIMTHTPEIGDVYFELKTITSNETGNLDQGIQVYMDAKAESGEAAYLKIEWEETWEYNTPYYSFLDWDFQTNREFLREENISRCWRGSTSTGINLATTENISGGEIRKHPVRFVPFREPSLRVMYSLKVKQFALTESSFRFWENLKESNESTGSLYDTQPFQVIGNIGNIQDESEPVLGYFHMVTSASKRVFIKNTNNIPPEIKISSYFPECLYGADTTVTPGLVEILLNNGYLISRYSTPPGSGFEMVIGPCIDCRLKGGSNLKPDFWK